MAPQESSHLRRSPYDSLFDAATLLREDCASETRLAPKLARHTALCVLADICDIADLYLPEPKRLRSPEEGQTLYNLYSQAQANCGVESIAQGLFKKHESFDPCERHARAMQVTDDLQRDTDRKEKARERDREENWRSVDEIFEAYALAKGWTPPPRGDAMWTPLHDPEIAWSTPVGLAPVGPQADQVDQPLRDAELQSGGAAGPADDIPAIAWDDIWGLPGMELGDVNW